MTRETTIHCGIVLATTLASACSAGFDIDADPTSQGTLGDDGSTTSEVGSSSGSPGEGSEAAPADDGTTTGDDAPASSDSSGDDGPADPATCDEGCSGHGTCVEVDGEGTCACDAGYYMVGSACLADPCEQGGTCVYVDAQAGDDDGPGTIDAPWRTVARVDAWDAPAGAYVLFRRGRQWSDEVLMLTDVAGEPGQSVTAGAYGPLTDARPRLGGIRVTGSTHVDVRDFEVQDSAGPCISTTYSDFVTIQDTVVHGCTNNGIHAGAGAGHIVFIDNVVYDISSNDALVIHSPTVVTEQSKVLDHHFIVDNLVLGTIEEQPIDVATGTDDVAGSRDVKILGNRLTGGGNGCIATGHGTSVVWIVGNLAGGCMRSETGAAVSLGGYHGANSGTQYQVRGNVIFRNLMAAVDVRSELPQSPQVTIERNTFVSGIGQRAAVVSNVPMAEIELDHNLVWTSGSLPHVGLAEALLTVMDYNAYVPDDDPACGIAGMTLAAWQDATGLDAHSTCAAVPGLSVPTQAETTAPESWYDDAFLERFIPDAGWAGCEEGIGAFDCDGTPVTTLEPFDGYPDNGGYGWVGPLVVRQRYPIPTAP